VGLLKEQKMTRELQNCLQILTNNILMKEEEEQLVPVVTIDELEFLATYMESQLNSLQSITQLKERSQHL